VSSEPRTVSVVSTALGPIEVAREGEGPPVLALHGTPGGFDAALAMGRFLVEAGFEVVAPSRPGYLGTPLDGRGAIDEQADLLAALLDALALPRAGVFSWSGGGPGGYRLAVRHPEKVRALVAFAAVSGRYDPPEESLSDRLVLNSRPGNWMLRFLVAHSPERAVAGALSAEGTLTKEEIEQRTAEILDDPEKRRLVLEVARIMGDRGPRRVGEDNDVARFAEILSLELERITAPTLIVHGSVDCDVPPEHSERAAASIPGSELLRMERGTHLSLFVHPEAATAQERVIRHLRKGAEVSPASSGQPR
jgi:pimeloyl-ACP methyl ester carboxylesterase